MVVYNTAVSDPFEDWHILLMARAIATPIEPSETMDPKTITLTQQDYWNMLSQNEQNKFIAQASAAKNALFENIERTAISMPKPASEVYVNGVLCDPINIPGGPLFIVYGPGGMTPIRYIFTTRAYAEKAANQMAKRFKNTATVFYVATFLSWHQYQHGSVSGDVLCNFESVLDANIKMNSTIKKTRRGKRKPHHTPTAEPTLFQ